jgi:hypothetical protein
MSGREGSMVFQVLKSFVEPFQGWHSTPVDRTSIPECLEGDGRPLVGTRWSSSDDRREPAGSSLDLDRYSMDALKDHDRLLV